MPKGEIYLTKEDKEIWDRAKALINKINKEKGTRISLSMIIMKFLRNFVEKLEQGVTDLSNINKIRIDVGSIEISTRSVEVKEAPSIGGKREVKLTHIFLRSKIDSWIRQLEMISKGRLDNIAIKQLNRIKREILREVKSIKTAPEDLANKLSEILANIEIMEKRYMEGMIGYE